MRRTSRGTCMLCQREFGKAAMTRHLEACRQKAVTEAQAGKPLPSPPSSVFHLLVQGHFLPMYWLHLDVTASTTLAALDQFLRDIWLECCGHLSAFTIADTRYVVDEAMMDSWSWRKPSQRVHVPLATVLSPGLVCAYAYDFGSTTELTLKVLAQREVTGQTNAIEVLARNVLPITSCNECCKPATH
ncbi:MAG: hypothetical protein ACRDHZ_16285, partial [Ktedonobacteraceae bacterium]